MASDTAGTCVNVRMRPPNARESGQRCLAPAGDGDVAFSPPRSAEAGAAAAEFRFNKVFGERGYQGS